MTIRQLIRRRRKGRQPSPLALGFEEVAYTSGVIEMAATFLMAGNLVQAHNVIEQVRERYPENVTATALDAAIHHAISELEPPESKLVN